MRHFICAAALLGLTSPAASAVVEIDLTLLLTAQNWYFHDVYDYHTDTRLSTFPAPEADQGIDGMPPPLGVRSLGDVISFTATINDVFDKTSTCRLADYSCGTGSYGYASVWNENRLSIGNDGGDFFLISGSMTEGEEIVFDWEAGYLSYCEYETGGTVQWYAMMCGHKSTFTVVKNNLLPSVPAPASLPMLATGLIGAGWWARRRRRITAA